MNILTVRRLFTFLCEGTMYAEFNSIALFTVLSLRFKHCSKDVFKVTAQGTILEYFFQELWCKHQCKIKAESTSLV